MAGRHPEEGLAHCARYDDLATEIELLEARINPTRRRRPPCVLRGGAEAQLPEAAVVGDLRP